MSFRVKRGNALSSKNPWEGHRGVRRSENESIEEGNLPVANFTNPLLFPEIIENVISYLPDNSIKQVRAVCRPWLFAAEKRWLKIAKIILPTIKHVESFVSECDHLKGGTRSDHLPFPLQIRNWEIRRIDHFYRFPERFFEDYGVYMEKLCLIEPESLLENDITIEDQKYFGNLFYCPLAKNQLLETLSGYMPNLSDLSVKFRSTSVEDHKEFMWIFEFDPPSMTSMNKLKRLEITEHVPTVFRPGEFGAGPPRRMRWIPEERFLEIVLQNSPNLEILHICTNWVRKEIYLLSLAFDEEINLPKLKHLPCPIPVDREIIDRMRLKKYPLKTLAFKLGDFSAGVPVAIFQEMLLHYKSTLSHLKLLLWHNNYSRQSFHFAKELLKVNALELWGYNGQLQELRNFQNLKNLVIGQTFGIGLAQVQATLPEVHIMWYSMYRPGVDSGPGYFYQV